MPVTNSRDVASGAPLGVVLLDTPIVLYSSVGYRAARVAWWLERQGYTGVAVLDGSLNGVVDGAEESNCGDKPDAGESRTGEVVLGA